MSVLTKTVEAFSPSTQDNLAAALGAAIGPKLVSELDVLSKAKQDWEGGPFKVMFKLLAVLTKEQRDALPDTKSETGNNPRYYKVRVKGEDGKEKMKDHDYYDVVVNSFPAIASKRQRIEMLNRSMKDPTKFNLSDVPQDVKDMQHSRRFAEISRLQGEISNAKAATLKGFELIAQFERFETLPGVTTSLVWAIGPDGKEMEGVEVDNTKTPIIIQTKLESRKLVDWTRCGVGAFLKYNVAKAMEQGGSYDALLATVKKGTKGKDGNGEATARNVNTIETALTVQNDYAEFLSRIQNEKDNAQWDALNKALHGAGSDDAFLNAFLIHQALGLLVGNPKDQVRGQKLFSDMDKAAA